MGYYDPDLWNDYWGPGGGIPWKLIFFAIANWYLYKRFVGFSEWFAEKYPWIRKIPEYIDKLPETIGMFLYILLWSPTLVAWWVINVWLYTMSF